MSFVHRSVNCPAKPKRRRTSAPLIRCIFMLQSEKIYELFGHRLTSGNEDKVLSHYLPRLNIQLSNQVTRRT